MSLTERQRQTVLSGLQKKQVRPQCPMCGQNKWTLAEDLVIATAFTLGGGMALGGPHVPMCQLICNNCGFVSHHAVGALGIDLDD